MRTYPSLRGAAHTLIKLAALLLRVAKLGGRSAWRANRTRTDLRRTVQRSDDCPTPRRRGRQLWSRRKCRTRRSMVRLARAAMARVIGPGSVCNSVGGAQGINAQNEGNQKTRDTFPQQALIHGFEPERGNRLHVLPMAVK